MDCPGGTVDKKGPGRSHMPRSNGARGPQLLSKCARALMMQLVSPQATTDEPLCLDHEACAP